MYRKNAWENLAEDEKEQLSAFAKDYMAFLNNGKTERECVAEGVRQAEAKGFKNLMDVVKNGETLKAGDRVYRAWMNKDIMLFIIGEKPMECGMNILGAHIDSPRIDIKQNPLYEDEHLAYLDTHYYGGIKKYQWPTVPLSLHGVIIKADGTKVTVNIGEDENDPVFCVSDLLPHLADEQYKRPAPKLIKGEELNIIIGSRPFRDDEGSELVKLNIMLILNEKYGIVESDFISAELEAVPAFKAKDVGFDRSLVGAYGQDDRVCAYTELMAVLELNNPEKTAVAILTDKEETGSDGNTGLRSSYLRYFIADLASTFGVKGRTVLQNSRCLSADVNAAFDPTFPDVFEKRNSALLNGGVCVTKYTGSRGKSGTSDASAEFAGEIRRLLDANGVIWQTGELGKVDIGGGGTVAAYIANLDVNTIDVGVPVLSMHAPFEITAKTDIWAAYRAFEAFVNN